VEARATLNALEQVARDAPAIFWQYRERCWQRILEIAEQRRDQRAALRAIAMVVNRTDPEPRPTLFPMGTSGRALIEWQTPTAASSSPTPPEPSSSDSMTLSANGDRERPSSSSTDALANL